MVTIKNLTVYVQNQPLLKSVSCSLQPGRITTFIGQSGAGKTTLLKALVGLMPVHSGSVTIDEKQLATLSFKQRAEKIGYVFQNFNLFTHLSVLGNCVDPLLVHGMPHAQAELRAYAVLKQLEMDSYADKFPAQLSGGQQQRVAIARALCLSPQIILLDEPTASLDPLNTDLLVDILKKLAAQGLIIGVSSQDMGFVRKIFDLIYYVKDGEIAEMCEGMSTIDSCPLTKQFIAND